MASNLLTSSYSEGSNGDSSGVLNWFLSGKILKYLYGFGELIAWLSNTTVDDKFIDYYFSHWVVFFASLHFRFIIYF
jgi:hypothetical protein